MRKNPNTPFSFEDEEKKIPLNAQCAVFITMNPGYAGRSELPDNLKALFRPVAMMIPNYEMIAEIQLYSFGFQTARELSVKIVQSLRLSSEQLSTQSHYDYGMRAVKSIILAAGTLKRLFPNLEESKLILRAIEDCNVPKFINEDIELFNGIIQDLFPTTDKSKDDYGELEQMIFESMQAHNLQLNDEFKTKTIQLFETVQVRHGLMLVGGAMGGKSTITNTLADALSRISKNKFLAGKEEQEDFYELQNLDNHKLGCPQVKIYRMNPKSVRIGQLYGDFEKVSKDWQDGILATAVKEAASDKKGDTHWIMLDGPVDAVWIENLNTVLDDNMKLCLISGEIIKLTKQMKMMFEVEDLLEASPATVSRCGMVYISQEKVGWHVLTT
jgi:dynein heavy chain, axonemal